MTLQTQEKSLIASKYLIFDTMLAVNELHWIASLPSNDFNLFTLTKNLEFLYYELDKFQSLVYTSNSYGLNATKEKIVLLLAQILPQIDKLDLFISYHNAKEQLKVIETFIRGK